jgi:hypothetical protein
MGRSSGAKGNPQATRPVEMTDAGHAKLLVDSRRWAVTRSRSPREGEQAHEVDNRVVNEERKEMKHKFLDAMVVVIAAIGMAAVGLGVGQAPAATNAAAIPYLWQNCTHVHTKYRHGVGKAGAHDKTSGTPVTTFYRSTRLYNRAMSYNGERGYNLDRDHDGIACEKR